MELHLDIEVIPNLDADAIKEIYDDIQAPGNYKKPESIAEWLAENREKMAEEQMHKACFEAATGRIICIGWAWDDGKITSPVLDDERGLLETFFADVKAQGLQAFADVVGHNVSWDVRYIWKRAVILGIQPPWQIKWGGKPWDHRDTMLMWDSDIQRRISLDRLCKALGVPTNKGDIDGSKVWQAYKDGCLSEIAEYCAGDVAATRMCYQCMTFAAV